MPFRSTTKTRAATSRATVSTATLRKSGGALILTVPKSYVHANSLDAGATMRMRIKGKAISLEPLAPAMKRQPTMADLLARCDASAPLPNDREWLDAPAVGRELI